MKKNISKNNKKKEPEFCLTFFSHSLSLLSECNNGADTFGARRRVSFFSEDAEVVVVVVPRKRLF